MVGSWMEIPDIPTVCHTMEFESLLDWLAWNFIRILDAPVARIMQSSKEMWVDGTLYRFELSRNCIKTGCTLLCQSRLPVRDSFGASGGLHGSTP
jgi:hypothetical protein